MRGIDLKIARIRRGATQHELGRLADLPSYIISEIETGRRDPRPDEEVRLRAALDSIEAEDP